MTERHQQCPECKKEGIFSSCPKNVCQACGKECHSLMMADDDPEWDECDECPYIEDTIDYEKLERDYPPPPEGENI